jgi:hypothetical protein
MKINKFNIAELFNNNNGKTSATAFCGILTTIIGLIGFLIGCYTANANILTNSILVLGSGTTLLGIRKVVNNKDKEKEKSD